MARTIHRRPCSHQPRRPATSRRELSRTELREEASEGPADESERSVRSLPYIWPQGSKYREHTRADFVAFLIRSRYA